MEKLFLYNWHVRNHWLKWCESLTEKQLRQERTGGVGSIFQTLFHVIDAEYSWLRCVRELADDAVSFEQIRTVGDLRELSEKYMEENHAFLRAWTGEAELEQVYVPWSGETFYKGEIIRHVIAHEIHHVGQLSIWSRDLGMAPPVSANLIGKGLYQ
ncbi:DinB family protein [Shouchella shacheensis]|uniref:DinB family protein n=1 Tax=Shouchella shacheensis TaxID=1649580 RepID=UPI000740158E|nr:DinB family protein [Shouchella shacheensis]